MSGAAVWTPSKYRWRRGRLVGSRDRRDLAASSRLVADLTAARYDDALGRHARGLLIDLGCGRAPLRLRYASLVERAVGLDWPASLHESAGVDVHCDLRRPLPLATGVADVVLSSDVLEHLPDPDLAIAEIARVLRPGGHLLLNTPFLYRVHEAPHDYLRHTRYSLERLCRDHGLEVVEVTALGGLLDVQADLVAKALEQVPLVGRFLAAAVCALALGLGRTPLGRLARRATGEVFPLAHFLVARRAG
ncbi:methyltransferase domain-containing protein [Nocardioides sp.]|uniref:methyltransferase domain-containing protein n=1 Tax=Nocardioides sp. TaxID=35761 RepID=UPI0035139FB6